jgi:hypothetical protein
MIVGNKGGDDAGCMMSVFAMLPALPNGYAVTSRRDRQDAGYMMSVFAMLRRDRQDS